MSREGGGRDDGGRREGGREERGCRDEWESVVVLTQSACRRPCVSRKSGKKQLVHRHANYLAASSVSWRYSRDHQPPIWRLPRARFFNFADRTDKGRSTSARVGLNVEI